MRLNGFRKSLKLFSRQTTTKNNSINGNLVDLNKKTSLQQNHLTTNNKTTNQQQYAIDSTKEKKIEKNEIEDENLFNESNLEIWF